MSDRRGVETIRGAEDAARPKRHAQCLEVARRRDGDERGRQRGALRLPALETELRFERPHRRKLRRGGHRADARQRPDSLDEPIEERAGSVPGVALARQRQPHRQHAPRLEPRVDALHVHEAAQQQPGAEEENDRQRDLRDDQRLPHAMARAPGARAAVRLQRFVRIGPCGLKRRQDPDEQPRGCREREAPQQHPAVDARSKIEHRELRGDQRRRRLQADVREQKPCGRAGEREEQALGQQVTREPPPPGAERKAHGQLALPRRRAREKQVREVGARDEEHERHGAEEHERGRTRVLEQRRRPRRRRQPPALVFVEPPSLGRIDRAGNRRQLRVRLLKRDARREPRQRRELPDVPGHLRGVATPGNPQVRADEQQPARHHADDRRRGASDSDRPLQDVGVAAEAALPQTVTDDRDARASRPELLAREAAAERRRHAEDRQRIVEQQRREHAFRDVPAGDVAVAEVERGEIRECAAPPDVRVLRRRHRFDVGRVRRELGKRQPDRDETIGVGVREGVQDEPVDQPVDEAVAADADRQREHRDGRESRTARELAQRVTDVLQQRVHFGPPTFFVLRSWFFGSFFVFVFVLVLGSFKREAGSWKLEADPVTWSRSSTENSAS